MSNQQESRAGSEVPAHIPPSTPAIDAHGFDPAEYKWVPVRRQPRRDGWSPRKMVAFIQALADTGCVTLAAKEAGMSPRSAYALRRAPGAERFAAAWNAAIGQAAHMLVDVAFDRALNGNVTPIYNRDGACLGQKVVHNDRLLMFLMRAHFPERYRTAHANFRNPAEPLPAAPEPVARSIETLQPVAPPAPHALLDADALEHELLLADLAEGDLPHFYDDIPSDARGKGDLGPSDAFILPPDPDEKAAAYAEPPIPFHPLPPAEPEPALEAPPADEEDGDWYDEDEDEDGVYEDGDEEDYEDDEVEEDEEEEELDEEEAWRRDLEASYPNPNAEFTSERDQELAIAAVFSRLTRALETIADERDAAAAEAAAKEAGADDAEPGLEPDAEK